MTNKTSKIGLVTAISFIVANMVGTGVFTSLGFQLAGGVTDIPALMCLWLIGGIIAFTGAQVYGELGSVMPRSGGEYHYLSEIYHPSVGFLSGFFSMFAGFAAPVALAAIALGKYTEVMLPGENSEIIATLIAAGVIVVLTLVHCTSVKVGGVFQNIFTIIKIALILVFIVCGFVMAEPAEVSTVIPTSDTFAQIGSAGFAVSMIFVYYAFSGWNASAYFVSEMKDPQRNLPRSLLIGTLIVTVLYLMLNYVFLRVAPIGEMNGELEVGAIAAGHIFGPRGGMIMSGIISLLLISSISSMVFAGPRVIQVIGEDYPRLGFVRRKNKRGVPVVAILLQSAISLVLLFTSTFEVLLTYLGLCMNLFCFLTVMGLFLHRRRYPDIERPYKTWGYPITPIVFMLFFVWNFYYLFTEKTEISLWSFAFLGVAFVVYMLVRRREETPVTEQPDTSSSDLA